MSIFSVLIESGIEITMCDADVPTWLHGDLLSALLGAGYELVAICEDRYSVDIPPTILISMPGSQIWSPVTVATITREINHLFACGRVSYTAVSKTGAVSTHRARASEAAMALAASRLVALLPVIDRDDVPTGRAVGDMYVVCTPEGDLTCSPLRREHYATAHWGYAISPTVLAANEDTILESLSANPVFALIAANLGGGADAMGLARAYHLAWMVGATAVGQLAERAAWVYGPRGRGKSAILDAIEGVLAPRGSRVRSASVTPSDMDDEYRVASLEGATINITHEVNQSTLKAEKYKQIVQGQPVTARMPYCPPKVIRCRALHIFASNFEFSASASDPAVWDRVWTFPAMGRNWREEGGDPQIVTKALAAGAAEYFSLAIALYAHVQRDGGIRRAFFYRLSTADAEDSKVSSCPYTAFVAAQGWDLSPGTPGRTADYVPCSEVYAAWVAWSSAQPTGSVPQMTANRFRPGFADAMGLATTTAHKQRHYVIAGGREALRRKGMDI